MTSCVDVKCVAKVFPIDRTRRLHAVDRVSFTISEGEALGVVGESGSGKSTLARMVAGLIPPDAGSIFLDGRDIRAESRSARAEGCAGRGVQFVFQDVGDALNPAFSARRNIAVGLGRLRLSRDIAARVDASARAVGLTEELLGRPSHQLSGGQQARVGLARALVSAPRLLVLDEPTASLDVSVQATILKLVDGLRRANNTALLFVSHDLEVVRLMCRRVLVLYLGRVAEAGPVEEILGRPAHPYTQALISAAPGRSGANLIDAEPLSPIDPPDACLFHTRCPLAVERCRRERPPSRTLLGRTVACHRAEESLWATKSTNQ